MSGMETYYASIKPLALLSSEEEVELGKRAMEGDRSARNALVQANLRLVVRIAGEYKGMGIEFDDLVSIGNLGLIRASEKYDTSKNAKFSTYCALWIKAFIRAELSKHSNSVQAHSVSAEEEVYGDGEGGCVRVIDLIPDNCEMACESVSRKEEIALLNKAVLEVLEGAKPRDKDIFIRRNGLFGFDYATLDCLAKQYGMTCEGVRMVAEKLMTRVRQNMLCKVGKN